jgi:pyridoxine/pyridoxamine 5'-phosphate oxidase
MDDPVELLIQSFHQARTAGDANAQYCALTTLDEDGYPVSRTVTVRQMNPEGIVIYINGQSPKVVQLKNNPKYELMFFWPSLIRQFRVRGAYEIFQSETQQRSWDGKPYAGKLYDLFHSFAHRQSAVLASRQAYLLKAEQLKQKFPQHGDMEMPVEQVSLRFIPLYIESWSASMRDRMHDRRLYRLTDDGWQCQVLVP